MKTLEMAPESIVPPTLGLYTKLRENLLYAEGREACPFARMLFVTKGPPGWEFDCELVDATEESTPSVMVLGLRLVACGEARPVGEPSEKCRRDGAGEAIDLPSHMEPGKESALESDVSFALRATSAQTATTSAERAVSHTSNAALTASAAVNRTMTYEAGVQTETMFNYQSGTQSGLVPGEDLLSSSQVGQDMSLEGGSIRTQTSCNKRQTTNAQFSPRPPKPHRVTLNTSVRALQKFKETPKRTVLQLIVKMAQALNPQGKGCCFLHIASLVLLRSISEILALKCRHQIQPYHDWQCRECLIVQNDDQDDPTMTEEDRVCELCCANPVTCDDSSSALAGGSSTAWADDEKSLEGDDEKS